MTPARWRNVLRIAVKAAQRRVGNVIADVDGDDADTRIYAAWGADEIVYAQGTPEGLYHDLVARPGRLDAWLRPIAWTPGVAEAMLAEQKAQASATMSATALTS